MWIVWPDSIDCRKPYLDALQVQVGLVLQPPHFLGRARVDPDARLPGPAHRVQPRHLVLVAHRLQLLALCFWGVWGPVWVLTRSGFGHWAHATPKGSSLLAHLLLHPDERLALPRGHLAPAAGTAAADAAAAIARALGQLPARGDGRGRGAELAGGRGWRGHSVRVRESI